MKQETKIQQERNKEIIIIQNNIYDIETTQNKIGYLSYSSLILSNELSRLKTELTQLKKNSTIPNFFALNDIKKLFDKYPIDFGVENNINNWNIINEAIETYEDTFKGYGIGVISIPNEVDNISYQYCLNTYEDVLQEVKKQLLDIKQKYEEIKND
jgi:hypothetical protein